jgi:hypothetical protein
MKSCIFHIRCVLNRMQANFEQFLIRIKVMGSQNINSTSLSCCAVEFGTNVVSAVIKVVVIINFIPWPPF